MTIVDATRTDAMTPDSTTLSSPSAATVPTSGAESAPASAAGPAPEASPAASPTPAAGWVRVCRVDDLLVERGAAALLGDRQIALFRTFDGRLYATDQIDPFSGAAIMSRGIVGDRQGVPTVASPMYKQVFDLRTGACLDTQGKEPQSLGVYPVAVDDGIVVVKIAAEGDPR
ncbi:nitrite reductase small subunit NirD [Microbacterium sp. VKM Ac-2923]|uniref:nitrite reductase small subunit NirD n=1 Tax=Microbacterium sp. VKM Ac-2923 TaxID=2929476 RepID=UPI0035AC0625